MVYLLALSIILALTLLIADKLLAVREDLMAKKINNLLPQTQCGRCNFPGCKAFAEALAKGDANINQCALIDDTTKQKISKISGLKRTPTIPQKTRQVAFIDESLCIGCTKCVLRCPTDCIIGSVKKAHTVVQANCSGCELCVKNCPTNAIKMITLEDKIKVEIK